MILFISYEIHIIGMVRSSKGTIDCSAVHSFFIKDPAGCKFIVYKSNGIEGPCLEYEKI